VTVTVGYPDGMPEQVERLPLGAVVHQEVYTDYTSASIDALYHDKEELEVNKQFVRENDKKTLAQVFTDVRITESLERARLFVTLCVVVANPML